MSETPPSKAAKKESRRTPKPVTARRLENIAVYHVERYPTSAANLRQVLRRRIAKAARFHETNLEQAHQWADDVVAKLVRVGLIDDRRYAEAQARKMIRRGTSARSALAKLAAKGVDGDTAREALAAVADEQEIDLDRHAAETYAQKRRLGPYRVSERTEETDRKDLAKLGRAGFPYTIAKDILSGRGPHD